MRWDMATFSIYSTLFFIIFSSVQELTTSVFTIFRDTKIRTTSSSSWYPPFHFNLKLIFGPVACSKYHFTCAFSNFFIHLIESVSTYISFHQDFFNWGIGHWSCSYIENFLWRSTPRWLLVDKASSITQHDNILSNIFISSCHFVEMNHRFHHLDQVYQPLLFHMLRNNVHR